MMSAVYNWKYNYGMHLPHNLRLITVDQPPKCRKIICNCPIIRDRGELLTCTCGENVDLCEWKWKSDEVNVISMAFLENSAIAKFHPVFSVGTCMVRGTQVLDMNRHYYWELKLVSCVYGTEFMVGVGAVKNNEDFVQHSSYENCLGRDDFSWGYSYRGDVRHSNTRRPYGPGFTTGSIIGIHYDGYRGTLEFFQDRQSLGVAFKDVLCPDGKLYPMACSTAAQSAIKVITAVSQTESLQILALKAVNKNKRLREEIYSIPGLLRLIRQHCWWLTSTEPIELNEESSQNCDEHASSLVQNKKTDEPSFNACLQSIQADLNEESTDEEPDQPLQIESVGNCYCRMLPQGQTSNNKHQRLCTSCNVIL